MTAWQWSNHSTRRQGYDYSLLSLNPAFPFGLWLGRSSGQPPDGRGGCVWIQHPMGFCPQGSGVDSIFFRDWGRLWYWCAGGAPPTSGLKFRLCALPGDLEGQHFIIEQSHHWAAPQTPLPSLFISLNPEHGSRTPVFWGAPSKRSQFWNSFLRWFWQQLGFSELLTLRKGTLRPLPTRVDRKGPLPKDPVGGRRRKKRVFFTTSPQHTQNPHL